MDDIKISEIKSLKDNGVYVVKFKNCFPPKTVGNFIESLNNNVRGHNIVFVPEVENCWEFTSFDAE